MLAGVERSEGRASRPTPPEAETAAESVSGHSVADSPAPADRSSTNAERVPQTRRELREAERRADAAASAQEERLEPGSGPHDETRTESARAERPVGEDAEDVDDPDSLWTPTHVSERSTRADRRAVAERYPDEKPKKRGPWGCLVGMLIVIGLGVAAFFFLQGPINAVVDRFTPPEDYEGEGTGEITFMINAGDGGGDIAANLADADIVASAEAFSDTVVAQSPQPTFFPGAYSLAEQMSSQAALDALLDPANKLENTFVITEGQTVAEGLPAVAEGTGVSLEDLQAAVAEDPSSYGVPAEASNLEGFLFPATYTLEPDLGARDVIQTLVDRQFQALDEHGVAPEDRWITIVTASLIQREAGLAPDYYKVSRVISNRLDSDLWPSGLLQFDSTVHYGLSDTSVVTTTDAERADESNPYNTYVHPGLTPGPISNPGDLAIDAAVNPEPGPWLYFVTWNLDTGETIFSETLAEHEAGVDKWLNWMSEHPEYG